jgi:hypothetical protein
MGREKNPRGTSSASGQGSVKTNRFHGAPDRIRTCDLCLRRATDAAQELIEARKEIAELTAALKAEKLVVVELRRNPNESAAEIARLKTRIKDLTAELRHVLDFNKARNGSPSFAATTRLSNACTLIRAIRRRRRSSTRLVVCCLSGSRAATRRGASKP